MLRTVQAPITVALTQCQDYAQAPLQAAVEQLFFQIGYAPCRGERVLVKPNLLRGDLGRLVCTEPAVVRAVCAYLQAAGCKITVGDSPGFGRAASVAQRIGLRAALDSLPHGYEIPVVSLQHPVTIPLSFGGSVSLSRIALEAEHILNLPRLKAHGQMRLSGAVKNLFGCVSGVHKALLHARYGDRDNLFPAMLVEVAAALPPVSTLMDAIIAMHETGPAFGTPYHLGLLGASISPVAMDTVCYHLLGVQAQDVAIWQELQMRNTVGAQMQDVLLVGDTLSCFDGTGFVLPKQLMGQSFHPAFLFKSMLRRWWFYFRA